MLDCVDSRDNVTVIEPSVDESWSGPRLVYNFSKYRDVLAAFSMVMEAAATTRYFAPPMAYAPIPGIAFGCMLKL